MKRIWSYVFGFALLVLLVIPAVVRAADPALVPAVCLIGDHPGIPESDAQTAALLVCDELRKQGISVTDPGYEAPVSGYVYRVVLRRLGEKIVMRLSYENPIGAIIIERQIVLTNIVEMIPAAPRLVAALIHDKPINDTLDMETVTEQEAILGIGIFSTFIPDTDIAAEPGYELGFSRETPSYAVGTEFRFSSSDVDEEYRNSFLFITSSIGGRYFFNKRNISPYAGGGLAFVIADYWEGYFYSDSDFGAGLGVYGVVGVEALRLTKYRLKLELRIDRPFFTFESQDIMPITVGISFSRHYVHPGSGCVF